MSKSLFSEFERVSAKAWKQKIQVDLKGADYNDTLIWKTNEGIDVRPFYHSDEFDASPKISASEGKLWKICQIIDVTDVEKANKKAIDAIERGAEHITFVIHSKDIQMKFLMQDINFAKIDVSLKMMFLSADFVSQNEVKHTLGSKLLLEIDIIHHLVASGNWYTNLKEDHQHWEKIVKSSGQLHINLQTYQNAGANIVQQLAYALAHTNEYLNHLENFLNTEDKEDLITVFHVSVGSNYFFEISKLRALRLLWKTLAPEFDLNGDCIIVATPSKRNKTIYDYNVNMLRTTTECMSAVLGGANVVSNLPYDNLYHKPNEFGDRISRNQLLVLKKESYFDKVNNPADGAYYIENLTQQLAEKALNLFKDIEANGGFLNQLKEGTIQRKIKESAAKEQADFDAGILVLLGTNRHPNPADKMKNELEINPFVKKEKRKTIIEPIIEKRLSEKLEINRLNNE
ncbi:methylmalonyl-CoA mutase subunit beta [uncultured Winogradskyella sp.]|uniref:methylmalonyl-CoA mutase subunit beta n=1 Tax=uncultured Winogradskyella sp. TaxID=395353 RepID=UPI0026224EC8|nr:methylmalonyl-CoA mutase subunit beta [uncultured Winogradskyella sp.]